MICAPSTMPDPASFLATCAAAVMLIVSTGAVLHASATLTRRLLPDQSLGVQLVAGGLIAAWLVVVVMAALLFLQLFHPLAVTASMLALAGVCRRWSGPRPTATTSAAGSVLRAMQHAPAGVLAVILGAVLLLQLARALLLPPAAWDSLTYHMTLPALWVQHGGYCRWLAPDAWADYSQFPGNGELFTAFLVLPFHGDLLANLVNFPFLLLGGAAVHALARDLGASRHAGLLAAALWCFAPPSFAYLTTQYVDIQTAAQVIAAWLFTVRFLRTRAAVDGALAGAGFGLAAGTKHLALVPLAIGAAIVLLALARERFAGPRWRGIAWFTLAAALASVPWYVRNWIETGNPVFPFEVRLGDAVLFAGSEFQRTMAAADAIRHPFLPRLLNFTPDLAPVSHGPPALLIASIGLGGLVAGLRGARRGSWLVLAAAAAVELGLFCTERMRPLREIWGDVSQRLILVSPAILLCGCAASVSSLRGGLRRFVVGLLLAALALDLTAVNPATGIVDVRLPVLVAVLITASAAAVFAADRAQGLPHLARKLWVPGIPLLVLGIALLQGHRDHHRHGDYLNAWDVHALPKFTAPGWNAVDDPERPVRIAYVAGWFWWDTHWFVYPLLGRRLQNELLYVPSTQSGRPGTYRPDPAAEARVSATEWIERLRRVRAEVLWVAMPAPPELEWVEANPQVFKVRVSDQAYRIYDLQW
ncbi:MAG TPA: hypothetical protein VF384_08960 [Planctomycetota bacterium]